GLTVFLPATLKRGDQVDLDIAMEGDFLEQPDITNATGFSYPRSTTSWYPRHGYLDRSEFKLTFIHSKKLKIVCVGNRISESPSPNNKDLVVTQYHMDHPIALATFALGPFVRHSEVTTVDGIGVRIPLEFNSVGTMPLKEDFIIAELNNSLRYFYKLFGAYPYAKFSASYHPYGFGQGFPSMLMIPNTDRANKFTYAFIAHETGHQWWGNIVAWRSYRDQWLSEGFAEYSGVLYTSLRDSPKASINLIDNMRASLRHPPVTLTGPGKGMLNDVGPIILGHRLTSSKTYGGYHALVYTKGALVLRMLHFLFTDPNNGSGDAFFEMMRDFVERYRNKTASTDDFRLVANEHFARTPIAKRYNAKDLNWFFQQWVYETHLPSYTLEYATEPQSDGSVLLTGNVIQEGVPENFFMPLPLRIGFGADKIASGTIAALGPKTPIKMRLQATPQKVELDPNSWVLSEKTNTK
ncbi:MAG TPA: M1 family aminopeptidase, partial [Pyrinomonadaceae bacterium]|nr:M1 family aminopeptidase [Pyrinomonadaceae bacterium]